MFATDREGSKDLEFKQLDGKLDNRCNNQLRECVGPVISSSGQQWHEPSIDGTLQQAIRDANNDPSFRSCNGEDRSSVIDGRPGRRERETPALAKCHTLRDRER